MRLPSARIAVPSFGPEHIVVAVALLLLGLFLYAAVQTAQSNYRLQQTGRDIQQEVDDLRRQRAELAGLREYMATDEYVESIARTRLGLVRPGETAVIVHAPESEEPLRVPGERWWESLFDR